VKNSKNVTAARRRIRAAELKARADPSLRLGKRTVAALATLQNGKQVSQILKALQFLQVSTQISKHCCASFAEGGATAVLFGLLRSCNRSQPHQELLRCVYCHLDDTLFISTTLTDLFLSCMFLFPAEWR
jgi:abnormal spindle-like microcephaly-associated protein